MSNASKINFPIQMYDPKREYQLHKTNIDQAISKVLQHGLFINGPEVKQLEKHLSDFTNVKHCIAVSNGTDALKIALLALDIGYGDEVITVAHTWISSAEVISLVGAKPVFVDINPNSFNMEPSLIEGAITDKTKAIIVVSLYGQIPELDLINRIAEKYNIPVIEDGAQSFGATKNGQHSCSQTSIATTSFFPSKPLGCYGDGGACFTNDDQLATKIRAIKSHGGTKRFHHEYIGLNARLDTLQAAILLVKFNYFPETIINRNNCASYYSKHLKNLEDLELIKLPKIPEGDISAWAQYSILANNNKVRNDLVEYLKNNQVNVAIFYPAPLHRQKCFSELNFTDEDLPNTVSVCNTVFNLPCYGEITQLEQDYIIELVYKFYNQHQ